MGTEYADNRPYEPGEVTRAVEIVPPGVQTIAGASGAGQLNLEDTLYLQGMLRSQQAQDAFRDGGERGYLDFVQRNLRAHVVLSRFAAKQRSAQPPPPPPSRPSGRYPKKVITDTPPAVDRQELEAKEQALKVATDAYAQLSARRRTTHNDALLAQDRTGARWQRAGRRVVAIALNPLERLDYRAAERLELESQAAAAQYNRAMDEYLGMSSGSPSDQINARLAAMHQFESRVRTYMNDLTYSQRGSQGRLTRSRRDAWHARLADFWFNGGKARRIGVVALSGIAIGVPAGIIVGATLAPWWAATIVGFGAAYAGRIVGSEVSRTVSRYQAVHTGHMQHLADEARARNETFAAMLRQRPQADPMQIDAVPVYEAGTQATSLANLQRLRYSGAIGGLAAAASFGVADWLSGSARMIVEASMQQAAIGPQPVPTQPLHPEPTPPTPNITPTPIPHVNVHDFPWNVAHQLKPGHEWDIINHALSQYNAANNTDYRLVKHAFGTKWTEIENGARALSPAQQLGFNQFMVAHT